MEEMEKVYQKLEAHGVEIVDDLSDEILSEISVDIDLPKDAFFPNLDSDPDWFVSDESETFTASESDSHPGMKWKIVRYERKADQ